MARRMFLPRRERCGVLCSMGMSRKQIAFDLSNEALKRYYPRRETAQDPQFFKRAYKDIQRFMAANGFEHRQHSVYVSSGEMTALDIVCLMQRMASQFPWLGQCAEKVDTTDIGSQHSLLGLLCPNAQRDIFIERQADQCPPALFVSSHRPNRRSKRQKKISQER